MIRKHEWLDSLKLKSFLQRSFLEFNVTDSTTQESIFAKYSIDLDRHKSTSLEILEEGKLVASAISCYQEFYADCGPLRLSFLSQVIVQPQYRGFGHLGKLMEFAQEVDEKNSSLASIVIARRKVGNLYSKYGYFGFGVFPSIVVEKTNEREFHTQSSNPDWELIAIAYENTYRKIPGGIYRSKDYWGYLRNEVIKGRISIGVIHSGNDLGYFIFSNEECFEIATTTNALLSDLMIQSIDQGIRKFRIGSNHPSFPLIVSAGGEYSIRPEWEEGHMMKPYSGAKFLSDQIESYMKKIQQSKYDEEKFSIDINLLNEW